MAGGALRGIRGGIRVVRLREIQESLAELG
jgi:hypothetical protein